MNVQNDKNHFVSEAETKRKRGWLRRLRSIFDLSCYVCGGHLNKVERQFGIAIVCDDCHTINGWESEKGLREG